MSEDDQVVCQEIKATIAFVVGRVAQENTPGGAWGELMWRSDSRVRVACTIKDVQMLIGGCGTKQGKMRHAAWITVVGRRFNRYVAM
jgi:hypothetical protein